MAVCTSACTRCKCSRLMQRVADTRAQWSVRSLRTAALLRLLPVCGAALIRLLGKTLRWRVRGGEQVDALHRAGRGMIIAFWHGQQLMMPLAYRGRLAYILISRHRDGEIIDRVIRRFGFQTVRGSTTRGGASALRHMIRVGRGGADVVVTPDGPKGPRHVAHVGVVQLAKATGMPIVPLAFGCSKKNSSAAGTAFRCRCRLPERHSSGETRCGSQPIPISRTSNALGWRCRTRSTV